MQTPWLRLAYTAEFLIALVSVFTVWSQVGGQGHLDIMDWYWKLGLGVAMSWAIVRGSAAAVEHDRAWNRSTVLWLLAVVLIAGAMAAITVYYHMNENLEEQDEEGTTALLMSPRTNRHQRDRRRLQRGAAIIQAIQHHGRDRERNSRRREPPFRQHMMDQKTMQAAVNEPNAVAVALSTGSWIVPPNASENLRIHPCELSASLCCLFISQYGSFFEEPL